MAVNGSSCIKLTMMKKLLMMSSTIAPTSSIGTIPAKVLGSTAYHQLSRRTMHEVSLLYEKNIDEVPVEDTISRATKVVPDELLGAGPSETTWAPHPETGVFAPSDETGAVAEVSAENGGGPKSSVLDEKAWFRLSAEDVGKEEVR